MEIAISLLRRSKRVMIISLLNNINRAIAIKLFLQNMRAVCFGFKNEVERLLKRYKVKLTYGVLWIY